MFRDASKIRRLAPMLLLMALLPARAVLAAEEPCRRHSCSNDAYVSATTGDSSYLGDERLVWNVPVIWNTKDCGANPAVPCTTDDNRRCFEVAEYGTFATARRVCEVSRYTRGHWFYTRPRGSISPYATGPEDFPRLGSTYRFVVRACVGEQCGAWSPRRDDGTLDYVEFVGEPYACMGSENGRRCEKRCYASAPKMFPAIPDCANPY